MSTNHRPMLKQLPSIPSENLLEQSSAKSSSTTTQRSMHFGQGVTGDPHLSSKCEGDVIVEQIAMKMVFLCFPGSMIIEKWLPVIALKRGSHI